MIFLGSVVTHNIVTGRCGQQVTDGQGVHLQYKIGDVWHAATTVATGAVRKYELQLLRRQGSRQDAEARVDQEIALASRVRSFCEDSSCNKDGTQRHRRAFLWQTYCWDLGGGNSLSAVT